MCQFCQKHTEQQHAVRSAAWNPFVRGVGRLVLISHSEMGWLFKINLIKQIRQATSFTDSAKRNVRVRLGFKSHRRPHPAPEF